jgi:hypothetical protein
MKKFILTSAIGLTLAIALTGCIANTTPAPVPTPTITSLPTPTAPADVKLNKDLAVFSLSGIKASLKQTGFGAATEGQVARWMEVESKDDKALSKEWTVVSLQYTVTNSSSSVIDLQQVSFGSGRWVLPEETKLKDGATVKIDDAGLVDFTDNSLHQRLGLNTWNEINLNPNSTTIVNLDILIPKSIKNNDSKAAKYVMNLFYKNTFSGEQTVELTVGE